MPSSPLWSLKPIISRMRPPQSLSATVTNLGRVSNPSTEEELCKVVSASSRDVDIAVSAARKAFKESWGKNVTGQERARLINALADLMARDCETLAQLECLNNGKPLAMARDFDIADSIGMDVSLDMVDLLMLFISLSEILCWVGRWKAHRSGNITIV